jgi:hypothetical protein
MTGSNGLWILGSMGSSVLNRSNAGLRGFCKMGVLVLIGVVTAACSNVQPWERGRLAKEYMALDPDPVQRGFRSHVYGSREAAIGGEAGSGGGCGCY